MLTINMSPGLRVTSYIATLLNDGLDSQLLSYKFLSLCFFFTVCFPRVTPCTVQYGPLLLRYDTSCWLGLMLSFTSSPCSYKCDIVQTWPIGFSELSGSANLVLRESLLSPTCRYGRGRYDQTSNVAIYAHASESSTIMMFTHSCHPQFSCIDNLNFSCVKHLNSFQATTPALTCWGG